MAREEKEDIDKQQCDTLVQRSYLKKERKKLQCPICGSTSVNESSMKIHTDTVHEGKNRTSVHLVTKCLL